MFSSRPSQRLRATAAMRFAREASAPVQRRWRAARRAVGTRPPGLDGFALGRDTSTASLGWRRRLRPFQATIRSGLRHSPSAHRTRSQARVKQFVRALEQRHEHDGNPAPCSDRAELAVPRVPTSPNVAPPYRQSLFSSGSSDPTRPTRPCTACSADLAASPGYAGFTCSVPSIAMRRYASRPSAS